MSGPRPPVRAFAVCALLFVGAVAAACDGGGEEDAPGRPRVPASLETDTALLAALRTIPAEPVEGFTGPGGQPFHVARRTPAIEQYPCGACHERDGSVRDDLDSHADIVAAHPARLDGDCDACHDPADRSLLEGRTGRTYGFDRAYALCAECHAGQATDWAGGAHGKRLGGWAGRRVVESCTGCHDPHSPAFGKRVPLGFPRIPRTGAGH